MSYLIIMAILIDLTFLNMSEINFFYLFFNSSCTLYPKEFLPGFASLFRANFYPSLHSHNLSTHFLRPCGVVSPPVNSGTYWTIFITCSYQTTRWTWILLRPWYRISDSLWNVLPWKFISIAKLFAF